MRSFSGWRWAPVAAAALAALLGCARRESQVEVGDREQVLHWGNLTEPASLDPQLVNANTDANIVFALCEGLLNFNPKDLHPEPGVAERWESNADASEWTFHLRPEALWSNGDPVTAADFVYAYRRMLSQGLASPYASMLFHLRNGEAYYNRTLTDFTQVGVKAPDPHTLVLTLWHPLPYMPSLVCHQSWFPVHRATIEKFGAIDDRATRWTLPGNYVGNGPFVLRQWRPQEVIQVERSPTYWNRASVRLRGCNFYPMELESTEEAAFRAGQLHVTAQVPVDKLAAYRKDPRGVLHEYTIMATYFYRLNLRKPPLNDVRVRRALSLAVERREICDDVMRGGQKPAGSLTTPGTGGFFPPELVATDIPAARKLLAEAGFPGGAGFPSLEILYNTTETHRKIAEAIQQMWLKNLGIRVTLANQEAKVVEDAMRQGDYQVARYGWSADYPDPSSFIDVLSTTNGNNQTGWSNADYDRLDRLAMTTGDNARRFDYFRRCEALIAADSPIIPIYYYAQNILVLPEVNGWYDNLLDYHSLNGVSLGRP